MALMDPNTGLGTEAPALDGTGKKIFDATYRREMARFIVDGITSYKRIVER